jgi:hypothetical protein
MESKEFDIMIKGGSIGVRIVKRSKGKTRSIFLQRDELVWLVGIVREVMAEETFKVFWDQSRAGYPRIITQKCSNRHGHFLTLEEFDGRRSLARSSFQKADMGKDGNTLFWKSAWQKKPFLGLERVGGQE